MDQIVAELILQDRRIAYSITDRNLKVVALGGAVELFGHTPLPRPDCTLFELIPELAGLDTVLNELLAGELPRFELTWVNRDAAAGGSLYLNIIELPLQDQTGQIIGLLHLLDDVTETGSLRQHLTQQRNELRLLRDQLARQNLELEAAISELKQLDELKSRFVSVAAHELRTPLTSISGYLEVLLDEEISPLTREQREYLEIVQSSAGRMLDIANNLLDVTRIEAGRIELVLQPSDLVALIQTVVNEIRPQLAAQAKQLTLIAAPNLPPALCDETRTMQIVNNLLSNAAKYTPRGSHITITVTLAEAAGFLQLAVADDGIGIPPADQGKLFNRFFRAGNVAAIEASGAGLGLYITRSLVELHGGRIWFESELNQGSTFYVTFPIAD